MRTAARFPALAHGAGHYESFYLKATRPGGGQAVWLRHTVHRRPDAELTGAIWLTLFDAEAPSPLATKLTVDADQVAAPIDAWIEVAGSRMAPGRATGAIAGGELEASWDLRFDEGREAFHHLPRPVLYRARLPRTKLLSPYPDSRFAGRLTIGGRTVELDSWPGMVGHNWGSEHAERWSWIQANDFGDDEAVFDAALGRLAIGSLTTPWIGNALLALDGETHRLGGVQRTRSTRMRERPTECAFELSGRRVRVRGRVSSQARNFVAWVYADPVGPEHHTANCSIADLELIVERRGLEPLRLECAGGAAYELGMRETDHGLPVQPAADG